MVKVYSVFLSDEDVVYLLSFQVLNIPVYFTKVVLMPSVEFRPILLEELIYLFLFYAFTSPIKLRLTLVNPDFSECYLTTLGLAQGVYIIVLHTNIFFQTFKFRLFRTRNEYVCVYD
jgi:hypothetical protein